MPTNTNRFNDTEIQILECGLTWIQEAGEGWHTRLFYLLANKSHAIHAFLRLTGPVQFGENLIDYLNSVLRELRSQGRITTSFKHLWPDQAGVTLNPLDRKESIRMAEAILEGFSELAEEAWSPILERTWRKALKAVLKTCVQSTAVSSSPARRSESFILAVYILAMCI